MVRPPRECPDEARKKPRGVLDDREQERGEALGDPSKAPALPGEVTEGPAAREAVDESFGLFEGEGETHSGQRIEGARSIADERDTASIGGCEGPEPERPGAEVAAQGLTPLDPAHEFRVEALAEQRVEAPPARTRQQSETDLLGSQGSPVELGSPAEPDLHVLAWKRMRKVPDEADPAAAAGHPAALETRPEPHPGTKAVGADDPARRNLLISQADSALPEPQGLDPETHLHPLAQSSSEQELAESEAPDAAAGRAARKAGPSDASGGAVLDPEELLTLSHWRAEQAGERHDRSRHQAFAASLVERGASFLEEEDAHADSGRADRGREPRRASADHDEIERSRHETRSAGMPARSF